LPSRSVFRTLGDKPPARRSMRDEVEELPRPYRLWSSRHFRVSTDCPRIGPQRYAGWATRDRWVRH
jgi:hypothetical protein